MQISAKFIENTYQQAKSSSEIENLRNKMEKVEESNGLSDQKNPIYKKSNEDLDQELKNLANEFTSILMKQMFDSMRNTLSSDDNILDGGYSEKVFTDMLDGELSQVAASQNGFNSIGRLLYQQLRRNL